MSENSVVSNQQEENKMGVMPINKLLISMSLPIMISMLVQALYNIVDSIFVAKISENALTAVSTAFPIQNLMIAVAAGTGVGVNAMLSKALGEKDINTANKCAENSIFLAVCSYILFIVFGLFFTRTFYLSQVSTAEIVNFGEDYLSVVCLFSFGIFGQITFERLLQSTGKTIYTMIIQGTGAIVNIILDPCLIFGLGFFPEMGVKGAAVATVIGQITACVLGLVFNLKCNKELTIFTRNFRPDGKTIKKIYAVGIPSIIMQSIASVMSYLMNKILGGFSDTAIAVFGVYFKLQSFVFMPVFGLNNGLVPILSYNFGAKKRHRMIEAIRYGCVYAVAIMVIGIVIMQLFARQLMELFDASESMMSMGTTALKIISISFVFAGVAIIFSSSFQALGNGFFSLGISVGRQLVVLVPCAYLLAKLGNVDYVWWSFPIAEIASIILSITFMKIMYTRVIKQIGD